MSEKAYIDAQNRAKSWLVNLINGLRAVVIDGDKDYGKLKDFGSKSTQQNIVIWHFKNKRATLQQLFDTRVSIEVIESNTGYTPEQHGYDKVKDRDLTSGLMYARSRWHILGGIQKDLETSLKVMELHMTGLSGIDGQIVVDNLIDFGDKDRRNYSFDESMFKNIGSFNDLWSNGKNGDSTEAPAAETTE